MAEYNINNSKIEQLNDQGDNLKIASNSAPVVVSGAGVTQTTGNQNTIEPTKQPESGWGKIWGWVKSVWGKWFGKT